ncbi:MAG TPA: LPXTG cell wall anchor domain-containing protein [Micromonosporaceae bacterium]
MSRTRTIAAIVVAALGLAGLVAFVASPANATEPDPHYATGAWRARDWTGAYPDVQASDASGSTATCDTVTLVKPDVNADQDAIYGPSADGDVGTSYENGDLNLAVSAGDKLLVDYTLDDVADAAAGAVRMFAYSEVDADTLNVAPTLGFVAAPGSTPGTIELDFAADTTVHTFGLTYDASNDTEGTVTFTNLRSESTDGATKVVTSIAFCAQPRPTATGTTPAPTTSGTGGTLPKTGSPVTAIAGVAFAFVVIGALAIVAVRRRRATS